MSIYDKKYQIFVSSTYTDLVKAREEVIRIILSMYQFPIGMEMFSADNHEQWDVIESTIRTCDYYILILGHRYGSVTKDDISYTEKEFDFAKENGIPILSFVRDRNIATLPTERDSEVNKTQALETFYHKVMNNSMCDHWSSEEQLGSKVSVALTKMFFKTPRLGWIRASEINPIQTTEELARLSQENRELRDELLRLKAMSLNEAPKLEVTVNNEALHLQLRRPRFGEFDEVEESMFSFFVGKVHLEQVLAFNKELIEKAAEIEKYKEEYTRYGNIMENNTDLVVQITNNGTAKANDIYVDLTFPKEVYLSERRKLRNVNLPAKPTKVTNPFDMANALQMPTASMGWKERLATNPIFNIPTVQDVAPKNYRIDKENNSLSIRLEKVTHTRAYALKENIIIAPLKPGNFEVNVTIVCDEYPNPITTVIPLIVE